MSHPKLWFSQLIEIMENLTTGIQMLQPDTATNRTVLAVTTGKKFASQTSVNTRNRYGEQQPADECMVSSNVQFVQGL